MAIEVSGEKRQELEENLVEWFMDFREMTTVGNQPPKGLAEGNAEELAESAVDEFLREINAETGG